MCNFETCPNLVKYALLFFFFILVNKDGGHRYVVIASESCR